MSLFAFVVTAVVTDVCYLLVCSVDVVAVVLVLVANVFVDRFVVVVYVSVCVSMVGLSGLAPEHKGVQQVISVLTGQGMEIQEASSLPPEHKRVQHLISMLVEESHREH